MNNKVAALEKFGAGPNTSEANGRKPLPVFAGFTGPSTDMQAVRDGRRAPLLYVDVPLDSTFSIAGGNAIILPISGNSFYVDQNTNLVGEGYVHFQDTNLDRASVPMFVNAGFIAKVPFTQILVENLTAQAGKILRICYGVDVDFTAGVNATLAIGDQVPIRFTGTSQQHTSTTASGQIVPASTTRKFVMIQNKDTALTTYISVGVAATSANGFALAPGQTMTLDNAVATNAMFSITPGGTNANIVHLFG